MSRWPTSHQRFDWFISHWRRWIFRNENRILAKTFTLSIFYLAKRFRKRHFPYGLRKLVSDIQPSDPIKPVNLPEIDVLIPCHPKDVGNLQIVIDSIFANVLNPIKVIRIITTQEGITTIHPNFPKTVVELENDYIPKRVFDFIRAEVPNSRQGWILQQVVKIMGSIRSEAVATLVIDSDTVLLRPKSWLDSKGNQSLSFAYEYHVPYKNHQESLFGYQSLQLSFVTHHQLFKKEHLLALFGRNEEFLLQWVMRGDYSRDSAISEYDTYGEWVYLNRKQGVVLTKWNNAISRIKLNEFSSYEEVKSQFPTFNSVSAHSYLD
jgi:hypothetical protein